MAKKAKTKSERLQFWIAIIIMVIAVIYAGWNAINTINLKYESDNENMIEVIEALTTQVNETDIVTYPIASVENYNQAMESIGINVTQGTTGYTYSAQELVNVMLLDSNLGRLIDNEIRLASKFDDIHVSQLKISISESNIIFDIIFKLDIDMEQFGQFSYYFHFVNTLDSSLKTVNSDITFNKTTKEVSNGVIKIINESLSSTKLTVEGLFDEIVTTYIRHFTTILKCQYSFVDNNIVLNK